MQFYENYVRLCNRVGKAPTTVAEETGISRATASRWSRGMAPSYPNLMKIADYFGISVGELVGATPETAQNIAAHYNVSVDLLLSNKPVEEKPEKEDGLVVALEALRDYPGHRALLSATKNMTEEQVMKMASFLDSVREDYNG